MSSEQDAVDTSTLLALRGMQRPGQPDVVGRIISRFLEETDERVVALQTAVATNDPQGIERAAHALKGIAGTVGATEILRLAVQLEQIGREQRTDGAGELVAELKRALGRARPIFDRLREPA
jgi:HPt (histidine-containing phosphotransfer) domain-containing protein